MVTVLLPPLRARARALHARVRATLKTRRVCTWVEPIDREDGSASAGAGVRAALEKTMTLTSSGNVMAKSLGQIHTVNFSDSITSAPGPRTNLDLVGGLTEQLNHMVRCGTYTKVVGIDMGLATGGTLGGGQITGHIRY